MAAFKKAALKSFLTGIKLPCTGAAGKIFTLIFYFDKGKTSVLNTSNLKNEKRNFKRLDPCNNNYGLLATRGMGLSAALLLRPTGG